jgi:hypothetical protein
LLPACPKTRHVTRLNKNKLRQRNRRPTRRRTHIAALGRSTSHLSHARPVDDDGRQERTGGFRAPGHTLSPAREASSSGKTTHHESVIVVNQSATDRSCGYGKYTCSVAWFQINTRGFASGNYKIGFKLLLSDEPHLLTRTTSSSDRLLD